MSASMDIVSQLSKKISENIQKVFIGKNDVVQSVLIGLLSQGHLLIEDVPGVGKTILARALAKSINCEFRRIQFTPDMLPTDIIGVSIYHQETHEFKYKPGPIISQVLLADEINRATPKTQSALLEAMEERQVTVDGITHILPKPFMVIATQNPIEYEGTFPLPEAQKDRFVMKVKLGYPNELEEIKVFEEQQLEHPITKMISVSEISEILEAQEAIKKIHLSQSIKEYIVKITRATRSHGDVYLGASPRASINLFRTAQAKAAISGRDFVLPDDIKELVYPVLGHRIIINPSGRIKNITPENIIEDILQLVKIPSDTK